MHLTPVLSLLLAGALLLATPATLAEEAAVPAAKQVCSELLLKAKKAAKKKKDAKAKAHAKGLQALAASIKRLGKSPENINLGSESKGITPLMVATALGEEGAIRWLIAHGADPFVPDKEGKDAFARSTDEDITELLNAGTINSWAEALEHLEGIPAEKWPGLTDEWLQNHEFYSREYIDREEVLKCCRKLSAAAEPDAGTVRTVVHASWLMGNSRMFAFMLRQYKDNSSYWEARFLLDTLKPAQCLPMLRLMRAHGIEPSVGHGYYGEILATHPAVAELISETLSWQKQLKCGAGSGSEPMVKAAIEQGRAEAEKQEWVTEAIANAMGDAIIHKRDNTFQLLFSQDRKGTSSQYAFMAAAEVGRSDILKQLVDDKPTIVADTRNNSVEEALHYALAFVLDAKTLEGILALLKGDVPAEVLSEALNRQAFWKHTDSVKKLLELGVVPTEKHLEAARSTYTAISDEENERKSAEITRLLQEAMKK